MPPCHQIPMGALAVREYAGYMEPPKPWRWHEPMPSLSQLSFLTGAIWSASSFSFPLPSRLGLNFWHIMGCDVCMFDCLSESRVWLFAYPALLNTQRVIQLFIGTKPFLVMHGCTRQRNLGQPLPTTNQSIRESWSSSRICLDSTI